LQRRFAAVTLCEVNVAPLLEDTGCLVAAQRRPLVRLCSMFVRNQPTALLLIVSGLIHSRER
jgi:hypothetical protein